VQGRPEAGGGADEDRHDDAAGPDENRDDREFVLGRCVDGRSDGAGTHADGGAAHADGAADQREENGLSEELDTVLF
jgi:hypothetical protein